MITLTDIEETWEELSPPIAVFANSYLPDGVTSTSSLLDAYKSIVNTEEETTVNLTEIDWVPSDEQNTVKSRMAGVAEEMHELAEEAEEEEHIEYFAGFYIYKMDQTYH